MRMPPQLRQTVDIFTGLLICIPLLILTLFWVLKSRLKGEGL